MVGEGTQPLPQHLALSAPARTASLVGGGQGLLNLASEGAIVRAQEAAAGGRKRGTHVRRMPVRASERWTRN
jgi:hypothetical protein